ncbi:hypothetical protein, partial [Mesorhizobium sp.]|uniref:hypothetical protein n=1 Tax=Mesorhizobium sp. TaxID=1871066 RepID=UPI0025E66487
KRRLRRRFFWPWLGRLTWMARISGQGPALQSHIPPLFSADAPTTDLQLSTAGNPAADRYRDLTGVTIHHTFWHLHVRRSDYGPDCQACGKPYRTSRAKFCAECGHGLALK